MSWISHPYKIEFLPVWAWLAAISLDPRIPSENVAPMFYRMHCTLFCDKKEIMSMIMGFYCKWNAKAVDKTSAQCFKNTLKAICKNPANLSWNNKKQFNPVMPRALTCGLYLGLFTGLLSHFSSVIYKSFLAEIQPQKRIYSLSIERHTFQRVQVNIKW